MKPSSAKYTVATSLVVISILATLTAHADTSTLSGSGIYGDMSGINGTLRFDVSAFESAEKGKSNKTKSSGAYIYGTNYVSGACWFGYTLTNTIDFSAKTPGRFTQQVIASGSSIMNWSDICGHNPPFTEEVTFNMILNAVADVDAPNWGTTHQEYGDIKVNVHYNESYVPADIGDGSNITSPRFGTVIPDFGSLGKSKEHVVDITQQH